jgi:NhaP-type Na+/H+ or K+/H+ antiporter
MLSVPLLTALLIGSVLAPTDPVLADSIIAGKTAEENVPERLRNSITAESGANDGLALLLVMMPILLLTKSPGDAVAALAPRNAALAG